MTGAVLSAVLGVLTLVSVVASAVAVAKASLAKSTIETLQQSNAALSERVDLLVADNDRQKLRLAALERENETLRSLASGSAAVEQVGAQVLAAGRQRQQEHHDILASIQATEVVLVASHEEVLALIRRTAHAHPAEGAA